jgi:hypothetical protein
MKWIVTAAFIIFIGAVVYGTISPVQASCEVCLEFDGELVCRLGAGATEEEALQAAQESTCGGNARGMSELIVCRNAEPVRATCSTR